MTLLLLALACHKDPEVVPPPPAEPALPMEVIVPTSGGLPSYDDVTAERTGTSPPVPLLVVTADGSRCFKEFRDPRAVDRSVHTWGGDVVSQAEEALERGATEVVCPPTAAEVLDRWRASRAPEGPEEHDPNVPPP